MLRKSNGSDFTPRKTMKDINVGDKISYQKTYRVSAFYPVVAIGRNYVIIGVEYKRIVIPEIRIVEVKSK